MQARGAAKQETRRRILQAGAALIWEKLSTEITLDDVAARSGVTVQTILRHFGTRDGLLAAVEEHLRREIVAERETPSGDVPQAVRVLFDHYEQRGDLILRLLGQEFWDERIHAAMDTGRRTHREWVEHVFAPQVGKYPEQEREELTDLLVVATDLYTWKLLRRDRPLDREQAERRVERLIGAILAGKQAS